MEAKCLSEPEQMSSDIISTLPQAIIETILCLLPIEEAARTSILSTEWRYKWTTIPKLVFHTFTVSQGLSIETQTSDLASATKNVDARCKLFYAIHQVLLFRQGPIHEFILVIDPYQHLEIDQIMPHLSRNHALKNLTLKLLNTSMSTKALLRLLSNCPSLTSFTLYNRYLSGEKDCTIIELFECLPLIEHLDINLGHLIEMFFLGPVINELPTSLIHLKYVCLHDMWLDEDELRILFVMIKCSPNLERFSLLELDCHPDYEDVPSAGVLEEYSDLCLEHLNELEIETESDYKHQINFVKFILARTPKLKKVRVSFTSDTVQQKSDILKALLLIPRASPVEIVVARRGRPNEDQTFRSLQN